MLNNRTLEDILRDFVRVYEERLLVDIAANLYQQFARAGGIHRQDIGQLLTDYPITVVQEVFNKYDADKSGVIDAREFLQLVRYLNFGSGYCDNCFTPIGENERGFLCTSPECMKDGYILCWQCYNQSANFHMPHHRFISASDIYNIMSPNGEDELPKGVGVFLRTQINNLFQEIHGRNDGAISYAEFRWYQRQQGCADSYIDFLLSFDINNDGCISKKELLYLITGQHMVRQCDECSALKFVGQDQILSCLECIEDYDVCIDCWNAGRCRHGHSNFRMAEPFALRFAGLYYRHSHADMWVLTIGDPGLWALYEPFIGGRLQKYAQLGVPHQYGRYQLPKFAPQYSASKLNNNYGGFQQQQNNNYGGFQQQQNNSNQGPQRQSSGQAIMAFAGQVAMDAAKDVAKDFLVEQAGEVLSWFFS